MHRKFSWTFFFIIIFSTSSICLLIIPYPETYNFKIGESPARVSLSGQNSYAIIPFEFPWRSYSQEIFINITLAQGTISIQILDTKEVGYYLSGWSYIPYWEEINSTGFATNIQISSPFKGYRYILFHTEDDVSFFVEIKMSCLRYASSYGFFFLGVAVILIFYYGYSRYKWWRSKY